MPFSHHSHSGQFCGHAVDSLEEVVQDAISKGMHTFCLTEHIPRDEIDFYPEEASTHTAESLRRLFDAYYIEATRLRDKYASSISIFIGFEGEWIRPATLTIIRDLLARFHFDLFVGSVHHVHTIPIDFDQELYYQARDRAGGTDEKLFLDYFDSQFEMLEALSPPVIGHFDLIRLKSDNPEVTMAAWPQVWNKIRRNLEYIAGYGGVVELNSASIRKGMSEPYPGKDICREFLKLGGRFTLSDDSHGTAQVGLNYAPTIAAAVEAGIEDLYYMSKESPSSPDLALSGRFSHMSWKHIKVLEVQHALEAKARD